MKIIYKTRILCLILLFSLSCNSNAQNESLRFEHIGIEEGLSNESVTAIFQDGKGYMWFGTMDGLNKYDLKGPLRNLSVTDLCQMPASLILIFALSTKTRMESYGPRWQRLNEFAMQLMILPEISTDYKDPAYD